MRTLVIVQRHAERQDEVDPHWSATAREHWNPPLSARGREQAEASAARLAADCEGLVAGGARVVAVVTSPFLRCLQTAAAACRRLGVPRMHVAWEASESLYRVKDSPHGPLPVWMWPAAVPPTPAAEGDADAGTEAHRPRSADRGDGSGHTGMRPEAYFAQLGARVVGRWREGQAPGHAHEEPSAAHLAGQAEAGLERLLEGLAVVVLPSPPSTLATPQAPTERDASAAAHPSSRASSVFSELSEAGCTGGEEAPAAATGAASAGAPMQEQHVEQQQAEALAGAGAPGEARGCADGAGGPVPELRQKPQQEQQRPQAPAEQDAQSTENASPPGHLHPHAGSTGSSGLDAPAAVAMAEPASGAPIAAAAAAPPPAPGAEERVPWSVPRAPETLEEAHARYRCLLRCLMDAAAAAAPQPAAASAEAPGPARALDDAAAAWQALWIAGRGQGQSEVSGPAAAVPEEEHTGGVARGAANGDGGALPDDPHGASAASLPHESGPPLSPRLRATAPAGDGEAAQPDAGVPSAAEAALSPQLGPSGASAPASPAPAPAVLVVTHGEAVACAATTVAPWVLVYEVRHTGYVVLASPACAGGGGTAAAGGPGLAQPVGGGGEWALLPDPEGGRGVAWTSALED